MNKMSKFLDGVMSLTSSLINRRNPINQNTIVSSKLDDATLRQIYRHGVANKIIRIKAGYSLKDSLKFDSVDDQEFYDRKLAKSVKRTARWMLAFGRGIIVLHQPGDDLSEPLRDLDPDRMRINVFSGDMVTALGVDRDLQSVRYMKPAGYNVWGHSIHWTRVVDFTYVEPPDMDAPTYRYGGVSEFELIHEQLIADGIVQRSSPKIIEKASSIFYRVEGFKDLVATGREEEAITYFTAMEDVRGICSAGLVDKEDEILVAQQSISNLSDADQITLRRLAMVTGIPLALLVGENVKGLNSTGETERAAFMDMIEALQSDYLLDPINELMRKCGQGVVSFKENQGETATNRLDYETKAINNALILSQMGEDATGYLRDKDIIQEDEFSMVFTDEAFDDETPDNG